MKKDRAPADVIDEPAAERWSERGGGGTRRRPRANRASPRGTSVCGTENRQARGHQERRRASLREARANRHAADGESAHAREASANPTRPIRKVRRRPKRSPAEPAQEDEAGERDMSPFTTHCTAIEIGVEAALNRRQRDVHDRPIDEAQTRPENRRGKTRTGSSERRRRSTRARQVFRRGGDGGPASIDPRQGGPVWMATSAETINRGDAPGEGS